MELDEFKTAWQTLSQQLQRQQALQWQLLRERKLENVRRSLRPLAGGQVLQLLQGIGLIALGVACWTRNLHVPGLFWSGVLVHAFGVVHAVLAAITLGLIGKFNYSAPVLQLQKHMANLRQVYAINAIACSAPWAVMWVPVLAAFIGLNPANAALPWLQLNLMLGVSGALFIYALAWFIHRRAKREGRESGFLGTSNAIRRSRELLSEIAEFERGQDT